MILRGILDRSLGNMVCIRGSAKMGDLARLSRADESYQRDLITEHKQEVLDFLHKRETLFFPEVVLSYGVDELPVNLEKLKIKDEKISIKTVKKVYKKKGIITDKLQLSSIYIKKSGTTTISNIGGNELISLSAYENLFKRIDGNHRLSAADEEKYDKDIQDLITPFCLLLLPKQFEGNPNTFKNLTTDKLEKTIFHNINYKHIPLKKEHHYKMMIGNKTIFTDDDLTNEFGKEYLSAREYLNEFKYDEFGALKTALEDNIYTFTHDLHKILLDKDREKKQDNEYINQALISINKIYNNHQELAQHQHYGLLIAFVYFAVRYEKSLSEKELNAFATWVVENFVYKVAQKNANNIIAMYENIIEQRYKEIFISMDFSEKYQVIYQAIKGVVDSINEGLQEKIKLSPIRIDQFKTGYSYEVKDEIFKQIEKCGLMIADLSNENVNVYQEVGFAMGLNRNVDKKNILLLKQDTKQDKSSDSEVGFNLRSTRQLRFTDTEDLRKSLKKELKKYYKLVNH